MDVEARVGIHKLDSSNFVSDEGFRGFIGPTGSVGSTATTIRCGRTCGLRRIKRSKRRWRPIHANRRILSSLARQSDIDDFAKASRCNSYEPLVIRIGQPHWDQEARDTFATLRAFFRDSRIARDLFTSSTRRNIC